MYQISLLANRHFENDSTDHTRSIFSVRHSLWMQTNFERIVSISPFSIEIYDLKTLPAMVNKTKQMEFFKSKLTSRFGLLSTGNTLLHNINDTIGSKKSNCWITAADLPKQKEKSIGFNNHANQWPSKQNNNNSTEECQRRFDFLSLYKKSKCSLQTDNTSQSTYE